MGKTLRRVVFFAVALIIVITLIPLSGINTAYAIDPRIIMSLSTATGTTTFLSNEMFTTYLDMDMTSLVGTYPDVILEIRMPSDHITTSNINASDMAGQTTKTVIDDGNDIVITYTFAQLTGGTTMRIPILIQTDAYTTPDQYAFDINAVLYDPYAPNPAEPELQIATPLTITSETIDPDVYKQFLSSTGWEFRDNFSNFGGPADTTDSNLISSTQAVNQTFRYYMSIPNNGTSNRYAGVRGYSSIIITDTLPAGAVFDPADNPGWTDNGDGTVSYTGLGIRWIATNQIRWIGADLYLTFPGHDVRNSLTNSISCEFIPENPYAPGAPPVEPDDIATDDIVFELTNTLPGPGVDKNGHPGYVDQLSSKQGLSNWNITIENPSNTYNMENIVIEDYDLDSRLQYVSIRGNYYTSNAAYVGTVSYYAVDGFGTETLIASGVEPRDETEYTIPIGTERVRILGDSGSYMVPSQSMTFRINTEMRDPVNTHTTTNQLLWNYVDVDASFVEFPGTTVSTTDSYSILFAPYTPQLRVFKSASPTTALVNDEITFTTYTRHYDRTAIIHPDTINMQYHIDLLPTGMEYVPGSTTYNNSSGNSANDSLLVSIEPTIVENYKGTDRTALIWEFNAPMCPPENSVNTISYYYITFRAVITSDTEPSINTNEVFAIWDNNGWGSDPTAQAIEAGYRNTADTYDLDDDGNTNELICIATSDVEYIPPFEVHSTEYVQGEMNTNFQKSPALTPIAGDVDYRLRIRNFSAVDINTLTVLSVMPYVGDSAIAPDSTGTYNARGTEFPVFLDGPITAQPGFTVMYTYDLPTDFADRSPEYYAANANWVANPADFSQVMGIRMVMSGSEIFEVDEEFNFFLDCTSSGDTNLLNGQQAQSSFAISVNGVDYQEANMRAVEIFSSNIYNVNGSLFEDVNQDGIINSGDNVFAGYTVRLVNSSGNTVLNSSGNPITAVTNGSGRYSMGVHVADNYRVAFTSPSGYTQTITTADSNPSGSHLPIGSSSTGVFALNNANPTATRNGGYYYFTSGNVNDSGTAINPQTGDTEVPRFDLRGLIITLSFLLLSGWLIMYLKNAEKTKNKSINFSNRL